MDTYLYTIPHAFNDAFYFALFFGSVIQIAFYAIWITIDDVSTRSQTETQFVRYTFTLFGAVASYGFLAYLITQFGVHQTFDYLDHDFKFHPYYGTGMYLILVLNIVTAVLVPMLFVRVYKRPNRMLTERIKNAYGVVG